MWQTLPKTVLFLQLNLCFWEFRSIFAGNYQKTYFEVKKWLSQKVAKNYTENNFFKQSFGNGENTEEVFWIEGEDFFWSNKWNGTNNTEKSFAPQNVTHQLNHAFLVFCRFLSEIDKKVFFEE